MSKFVLRGVVALALVAALGGCSEKASLEPAQQSGNAPPLPKAQDFLLPPMQVPIGVGWAQGQSPKVAPGLKIEKIASGLMHPRQALRPAQWRRAGRGSQWTGHRACDHAEATDRQQGEESVRQGRQRRQPDHPIAQEGRCGGEWEKHVFIEHLHSPFGVQLIGDSLYVANTDAIVKFPYQPGDTQITAPGVEFADLPGGRQPSLDQGPVGEPGRQQAVCRGRLQQQCQRERLGSRIPARGGARGGCRHARQPNLRIGHPQSDRPAMGTANRQALGHRQRTRRDRRRPRAGLSDLRAGRRILWMAL